MIGGMKGVFMKSKVIDFIQRAKKIHLKRNYDYSLIIDLKNLNEKVSIICPKHGEFKQKASHHLNGSICKKCSYEERYEKNSLSFEDFEKRAKEANKDKYVYVYKQIKNCKEKVSIICPKHGEFKQSVGAHLSGQGCPDCGKILSNKLKSLTRDEFIERCRLREYNYDLVGEFNNLREKIIIICPKHGEFKQSVANHLNGQGCPKCAIENSFMKNEDFIIKSKEIHKDKYIYNLVDYKKCNSKVCIVCPKHGEFWQSPTKHLLGQGCPKCKRSIGETKVEDFLIKNKVIFINQKRFKECRNKYPLPFDFYLPEYNTCIEYDGEQHFKPSFGNDNFNKIVMNDEIKNMFCRRKNIKLIRIPYWERNNIEIFLEKGINL